MPILDIHVIKQSTYWNWKPHLMSFCGTELRRVLCAPKRTQILDFKIILNYNVHQERSWRAHDIQDVQSDTNFDMLKHKQY